MDFNHSQGENPTLHAIVVYLLKLTSSTLCLENQNMAERSHSGLQYLWAPG